MMSLMVVLTHSDTDTRTASTEPDLVRACVAGGALFSQRFQVRAVSSLLALLVVVPCDPETGARWGGVRHCGLCALRRMYTHPPAHTHS
jgi:hypothetical protein